VIEQRTHILVGIKRSLECSWCDELTEPAKVFTRLVKYCGVSVQLVAFTLHLGNAADAALDLYSGGWHRNSPLSLNLRMRPVSVFSVSVEIMS
jgi:hypothetical protein